MMKMKYLFRIVSAVLIVPLVIVLAYRFGVNYHFGMNYGLFASYGIKPTESEFDGYMIDCYDVNAHTGDILICCEGMMSIKTVEIYTPQGSFQYGYTFLDPGSIAAEWEGDNVIIYSVRGGYGTVVDREGNTIEVRSEIGDSYLNKEVCSGDKTVSGTKYRLRHSKLVRFAPDGSEITVFDRSGRRMLFNWSVAVYFIVLTAVAIIRIVKNWMKNMR